MVKNVRMGLNRINELAAVFDRGVHKLPAQIFWVFSVPDIGIIRTGDVDTIARTQKLRKGKLFGDVSHVISAFFRVWVEHVLPGAYFGDYHILARELPHQPRDPILVGYRKVAGSVGRAIAKITMGFRKHGRIVGFHENRSPQPHRFRKSACSAGQRTGGENSCPGQEFPSGRAFHR